VPVLVLPLTLLIILGLTGLRGAVTKPRWDGPLHRDGVVIGLALEVVLGVLLAVTIRRRAASAKASPVITVPANEVAVKLRGVLVFVLSGGMIAVAVTILVGLHLHVFNVKPQKPAGPPPNKQKRPLKLPSALAFPVRLARWLRDRIVLVHVPSCPWPSSLRTTACSALRRRRSCYLAMEASLAERGTARAIADTPDELLARARATGIVRGTAAARLTALFYEARFSSHPLDHRQRDTAEQALDELAAALAEAAAAGTGGAGTGRAGTGGAGTGGAGTGGAGTGRAGTGRAGTGRARD
jgi:hypothetical protein